jgi:hypothetical protein
VVNCKAKNVSEFIRPLQVVPSQFSINQVMPMYLQGYIESGDKDSDTIEKNVVWIVNDFHMIYINKSN